MLNGRLRFAACLRHIWWGVSVEDKRYGLPRVEHLRATQATIKFLSIEPLLQDLGKFDISGIKWAIVGGESGRGARPMHKAWVENILRVCRDEKVLFFFKQWGGVRKSKAGRRLHDRTYDEMPERCNSPIPSREKRALMLKSCEARILVWQPEGRHEFVASPKPQKQGLDSYC